MTARIERFVLQDEEIEFDLFRKKSVRRNIHVRFSDEGRMRVSAPKRSSIRSVHLVLDGMHDQIAELRRETLTRIRNLPECRYVQAAPQRYLGEIYKLNIQVMASREPGVELHDRLMEIRVREYREQGVRDVLWRWLRHQAQQHFQQRITFFIASTAWLQNIPYELRLRKMKRTWGTCSIAGKITLNPLLMKAPHKYIDYVIAHELCHLLEHNHGPGFYQLLEQLQPDWHLLRMELNEHSQQYLRW